MERFTVNLAYGRDGLRKVTRNGREYLVARLSLLVPGVLNGSQGPLLYPPEEVSKNPTVWNNVPIVVGHPEENGEPVSARQPSVLDKSCVGNVYYTAYTDKLRAEAWFDVEQTRRVDNRVLAMLQQGQPIESSTGLFTDNEEAPKGAAYGDKPYSFIARNYRPDHLAVLPDQIGACSVNDGCGVNVNQSSKGKKDMTEKQKKELVDSLIANSCCWQEEDREVLNELTDGKLKQLRSQADKDQEREAVVNAAREGFEDQQGNSHTFNEEMKEWESKIKEPTKKVEPVTNKEDEGEPEAAASKPQTTGEWMATAPPEVQSAVQNAMDIENREKRQLIEQLTANLSDEEKAPVVESLQAESIAKLRVLSPLAPKQEESAGVQASYVGASAPATNQKDDYDRDDFLPLPVTNWSEKAS